MSCDDVPAEPLSATGTTVGIDLGVASLVTTSDGEHLDNPRHLAASADRLVGAQRDLARKKRGGARRWPASPPWPSTAGLQLTAAPFPKPCQS
ncbi:transposase [Streptosporangium sp. NPDC049046]|uniref:transposase n=1 Tax=Streptosporangium sp. NPDC049046 TaxID=3155031 RepID=UPI003425A5FA